MSIVQKVSSGLVYYDNFQGGFLNPLWNIVPTTTVTSGTRYSLTDIPGALRLKCDDLPTYGFLQSLSDNTDFVLDIRNNYQPINQGDQAGLLVYSSESDSISVDQYYDGETATQYPYLRLIRTFNDYEAYASLDGTIWQALGRQTYWNSSPQIGVYLQAGLSQSTPATPIDSQPMDLYEVKVYNGTKVTVTNLVAGMVVELVDTNGNRLAWGNCLTGKSYAEIDVSSLPMPFLAGVNIYGSDGSKMTSNLSSPITFWGGDTYKFSISPDVYWLEENSSVDKLDEDTETFLGYINGGSSTYSYRKLMVQNNTTGTFSNLNLALQEYNNTNDYLTMASIALDDGTGNPETFTDTLSVPTLESGQSFVLWVKIMRDNSGIPKDQAFFQVQIESTYSY